MKHGVQPMHVELYNHCTHVNC